MQIHVYNLLINLSLQSWTANPIWAGEAGPPGSGRWQLWLGMDEWAVVPKGVKHWKPCRNIRASASAQRLSFSQAAQQKVDLVS